VRRQIGCQQEKGIPETRRVVSLLTFKVVWWDVLVEKLTQIALKGKEFGGKQSLLDRMTSSPTFDIIRCARMLTCTVLLIEVHCLWYRLLWAQEFHPTLQHFMHIPDGFLDVKTAVATGLFSATGLGAALRHAARHLASRKIPLIGLTAAFIFVAQMLNFPVASGTSGHLLGATFAAVLLGPSAAIIVMSSVLIVQSLIFADGGILALGANIFNMAIVAPLVGYGTYRSMRIVFHGNQGQLVSVGFASWLSTVVAAVFCAGELAWSGTADWRAVFPAMAGVHMLTGLGESAITMLVVAAIGRARPELVNDSADTSAAGAHSTTLIYAALIVTALLLLVAPHASTLPDGLEKIAVSLGFEHQAAPQPVFSSPLKEYQIPGIKSASAATILAGTVGAVFVFALSLLFARVLSARTKSRSTSSPPSSHL
jgi:cobalt/nickel transport system permease protein